MILSDDSLCYKQCSEKFEVKKQRLTEGWPQGYVFRNKAHVFHLHVLDIWRLEERSTRDIIFDSDDYKQFQEPS